MIILRQIVAHIPCRIFQVINYWEGIPDSDTPSPSTTEQPPVKEVEVIDLVIKTRGDQGDGIAKIGPGYVVIVPETTVGERVAVWIDTTKGNVASGEAVKRYNS